MPITAPITWMEELGARLALRAAKRSFRQGKLELCAVQFSLAAIRAQFNSKLSLTVHKIAGMALLDAGMLEEAVQHFSAIAAFNQDDIENHSQLARAAEKIIDPIREIQAWRMILASKPDCVDAHKRLAELLFNNEPAEAQFHLEALIKFYPKKVDLWRKLAKARVAAGSADKAAQAWRRVIEFNPADCNAHEYLAEFYWREGSKQRALASLEFLARFRPQDVLLWERLAEARAVVGDAAGEILARKKTLARRPRAFDVHRRIGELYLSSGAPHRAIPHLRTASAMRPKDRRLLVSLAGAFRDINQSDYELDVLTKLFDSGSKDTGLVTRLADLLIEKGCVHCATRTLREAANRLHGNSDILRRFAETLEAVGAPSDEIIEAWEAVLSNDNSDALAQRRLSHYLVAEGRLSDATPHLKVIANEAPDDLGILLDLARSLDVVGEISERIASWKHVLQLESENREAHQRLAQLLEEPDPGQAAIHLKELLRLAPLDEALWRRLADVYQRTGEIGEETNARLRLIEINADDMTAHTRLVDIFLERGEANRAAAHLAFWLGENCRDKAAWEILAKLNLELGDCDGALEAWRRARELGPLDRNAAIEVAKIWLSKGRPQEAIAPLKSAPNTHAADVQVLRLLARAFQQARSPREELTTWKQIIAAAPRDRQAIRRVGALLFEMEEFTEAAPFLRQAIGWSANNSTLARQYALALRVSGDVRDEIDAWKRVLSLKPNDLEAQRRLGDLYFGQKRFRRAALYLERASKAGPHDQRILRRAAKAFRRVGDGAGEVRTLKRLISTAPADHYARRRIAELLQVKGDHKSARQYMKDLVDQQPKNVDLQRNLATCCQRLEDAEGEIAALSAVIKLQPDDIEARSRCGALLLACGALSDAERHLNVAVRATPENVLLKRLLARCYREMNRTYDERMILEQLLSNDNQDVNARHRLAQLMIRNGETEEAIILLQECAAAAPKDVDILRALAEAITSVQGEHSGAAAAWARLLELNPDDQSARRRLADAHFESKNFRDAESIYNEITKDSAGDKNLWKRRVHCARMLRGPKAEENALREAVKLAPDIYELRYDLSEVLIVAGASEGVRLLRDVWRDHPDPVRYAELCGKLVEAHQTDAALEGYAMLSREAPQCFAGWLGLGEILSRMGRWRLSTTYFGKAYEISGERSHSKRWIGSLLAAEAYECAEQNCAALSRSSGDDNNMRWQHVQALAGLGRFADAERLAELHYHPPDQQDREGVLRYLGVRRRGVDESDSVKDAQTVIDRIIVQAEYRQAQGDLCGAAQSYRAAGPALRDRLNRISVDGVNVSGPDFLIIGAPRSGSSWLKNCLKRHPQLRVARGEPSYFSDFPHFSPAIYASKLSQITSPPAGDGAAKSPARPLLYGEKTPTYLTIGDDAIDLCAALYPDVRLVCVTREPSARAWSHLKHNRLAAGSAEFYLDKNGEPYGWLRGILEFGRYQKHLLRWARKFPPEQFLILDFARIEKDPFGLLRDVQKFLGVEIADFSNLEIKKKKLTGASAVLAAPPDIEKMLATAYENEIYSAAKLQHIIEQTSGKSGEKSQAA